MSSTEPKAKIMTKEEERLDFVADGLQNLIANLGTGQDKRQYSRFVNNKQLSLTGNRDELNAMYRSDWLAGKIVDIIPDDMTREWREFTGDIDPDVIDAIEKEEVRLNVIGAFNKAHKWARLYGTGFIVLGVDDGVEPDQPLNVDAVREGRLQHLTAIDRNRVEAVHAHPIANPLDKNFGMPEHYIFNETSVRIHHSRMLRFDGIELPFDEMRRNNYFSDSVLSRLYEALINFSTVSDGSASMVYETNVDIVKIKGLTTHLQNEKTEEILRKRFALANMLKSFNNMLLLDTEEDFESKTNTFAGLHQLLNQYALFLSAASDVPATRLLGSSASGLNATGEGDLKNYYDTIRSQQVLVYKPRLDYLDVLIKKNLGLADDADMSYQFKSLFQESGKDASERQYIDAQRDALYLDRSVVTEVTVAKELQQKETYTNITDDDIVELEAEADFPDPEIIPIAPGQEPPADPEEEPEESEEADPEEE